MYKYFYFEICPTKNIYKSEMAFSLAEILLSLLIIGVVTSLVIPAIIADTQKAEIGVKVRKYQSILTQAIMDIQFEYGTMLKSPLNASSTDHANGWNTLKPKLNLIRDCGASTGGNCWGHGTYKFLNGNSWTNFNNYKTSGKGILEDGSSINYESSGNCAVNRSGNNTGPLYKSLECAVIFIDTNGPKLPNKGGRDVFTWHVLQNGTVVPFGVTDDKFGGCDPNSQDTSGDSNGSPGRGGGCTMQVLRDGKVTY